MFKKVYKDKEELNLVIKRNINVILKYHEFTTSYIVCVLLIHTNWTISIVLVID